MATPETVRSDPRYRELPISEQDRVEFLNSRGEKDPRCPICKDKLLVYITPTLAHPCECKANRDNERAIASSGLTADLKLKTFSTFQTRHQWQLGLKQAAISFCEDNGKWFFAGGQVGCGKTHICTAIINELMGKGRRAKYMVWPTEVDSIKGNAEDSGRAIDRLMNVPVLYIDDFLKTSKERKVDRNGALYVDIKAPTPGELNAAFRLICHRYNSGATTIISSEFTVENIMAYDLGLGSRIHEKTKGYQLIIGPDDSKNMRIAE
ncbi:hypothetical protein LJC60_01010 [Ruminococcaceae bacterium OttesenSCG-928-D13]|nr:hypothetical protein [Ruminococcaceae bacterium OttesenSCG-928-D13]